MRGFVAERDPVQADLLPVEQGENCGVPALPLRFKGLARGRTGAALTPTFSPPNMCEMRTSQLQASPRVYPGQTVTARVIADRANTASVSAGLRIGVYGQGDRIVDVDGPAIDLAPGADGVLTWTLADHDGQPIQRIGVALARDGSRADGAVWLDYLRWDGAPRLKLRRPRQPSAFWRYAWVNNVQLLSEDFAAAFRISQDRGVGTILHGTREWTDYRVASTIVVHLCSSAGLARASRVCGATTPYCWKRGDGRVSSRCVTTSGRCWRRRVAPGA